MERVLFRGRSKWYTRGTPEMGTAYSEIWDCSAAVIGRGTAVEINWVKWRRAAAQYILRRSDSIWANAMSRVSSKRCMACEVVVTHALPRASMCKTRHMACTGITLPDCLRASMVIAVCVEKCCKNQMRAPHEGV